MAANSKFAVAVHLCTILAVHKGEFVSSEKIAKSINTNPVVVRRLICCLCHVGLVNCQLGKCGGAKLARDSKRISLLEIYKAVETDGLFAQHAKPENPDCKVSCNMKEALSSIFQKSEKAVEKSLSKTSLAKIVGQVL